MSQCEILVGVDTANRISYIGVRLNAAVAQLDRASAYEAEG